MTDLVDSLVRYCGDYTGELGKLEELDVDIIGAIFLEDDNRVKTVLNFLNEEAGYDLSLEELREFLQETNYLFMTTMFDDDEIFLPRYRGDDMWRPAFPRRHHCDKCGRETEVGGKVSLDVCMKCLRKERMLNGLR